MIDRDEPKMVVVDTRDNVARVAGLAAIGVGLTTLLVSCAGNIYNFAYNCANENILWRMAGMQPSTVVECIQEAQHWAPWLANNLSK